MAAKILSSLSSKTKTNHVHQANDAISIFPQNLLFYYESETSTRPSGIIFLEGCYCERLVSAPACIAPGSPLQTNNNSNNNSSKTNREEKLQVMKISGKREVMGDLKAFKISP